MSFLLSFPAAIQQYDEQGEDSFDANAFFKSIGQGATQGGEGDGETSTGEAAQHPDADVNNDLQLSESDNDDNDFVPVDENSESNFDMGDFLKQNG